MRRAVVLLPNGFTLGNLFFGVFAIVSASRGDFEWAGWCVVLGGVADAMDGRIARMTRTGSRFGVELDSLVDAISFGVAPAFIMYFAVLNRDNLAWLICFIYIACAVMRLARFNIEQGGRAKTQFHGLPSPAAGITLATYYWFSQTSLYTETMVSGWPWHTVLPAVMLVLSFLMISHVLYPAPPNINFRKPSSIVASLAFLIAVGLVVIDHRRYAFPVLVLYVGYGLLKTFLLGLMDRLPSADPLLDDDADDDFAERQTELAEHPHRERRRPRGGSPLGGAHGPFTRESDEDDA
jgi:CDP-diacylglycerol--serine O-phosphatidyltransferase